jgi:hypothetical protein
MEPVSIYSADSPLVIGSRLFFDSSLTNEVFYNFYYSDGTTCYRYQEIDGFGEITQISSCTTATPTPTATATPTPTPAFPQTIYISGAQGVCSTFCGATNYLINTQIGSDNDYNSLSIGDFVDIASSGFYAYSSTSTDTNTGPFRIMEVDSSGQVLDILVCSGGSCVPL